MPACILRKVGLRTEDGIPSCSLERLNIRTDSGAYSTMFPLPRNTSRGRGGSFSIPRQLGLNTQKAAFSQAAPLEATIIRLLGFFLATV